MKNQKAPSIPLPLARKSRIFIWGFAALCIVLLILAWLCRPRPSAALWRVQEDRVAAHRAYDARMFVDTCNAALEEHSLKIIWNSEWKLSLPEYDLYSRDMTVQTPDNASIICSLVALSKEQPDADASLPFQKVMLSYVMRSDAVPNEIPSSFHALFQTACNYYEPGLADQDPEYASALQSRLETCFSSVAYDERFSACYLTSAECPTVFRLYSENINGGKHLLKCVTIHTCPESCQE